MVKLINELEIVTPNGLQLEDMMRVEEKLLLEFPWLQPAFLTVETVVFENNAVSTHKKEYAKMSFVYDDEPFEQIVTIAFDKYGKHILVCSNDADAAISVYKVLCDIEWGWILI